MNKARLRSGQSQVVPNMLMRRGVYKSVLEIGMTITVQGFRARDGSNNAAGRQVTRSDGSNVFAR